MAKNVQLTVDIKGVDSVGKAAEKTKSLRQELKALQTDLQSGNLTGKAFDEGIKKAAQMKDQINDVNNRVKALATDGADVALKGFGDLANGIVGGFAAAQGAMALFGSENKDVQKSLMKVQGAVALLNGVQAINNALQSDSAAMMSLQNIRLKILTFAQARYTAAVGTATGAMKIMRIVGMTLGIGLIVAAVGLLIANFDKVKAVVMGVVHRFKGMSGTMKNVLSVIFPFIGAIRLVVGALEKMGIIDDDATSAMKKNAAERLASQRAQVKELTKTQSKLENYYDFEIAKAKAAGKNTYELEQKKREEILKTLRLINDAQRESITNKTATEDEIKAWNERQKLITQIQQEGEVARIDSETKTTEKQNEINKKAAEKRKEEIKKRQDDVAKDALDRLKLLEDELKAKEDIEDQYNNNKEQKELDAQKKYGELIEQRRVDDLSVREKELFDIEEKYRLEKDAALNNAILLAEIETDKNNALALKKKEFAEQDADAQKQIDILRLESMVSTANQAGQLLGQIAGKNKALALSALAIEKGAAIASVIINAGKELGANAAASALNPLNATTFGAAGAAQLLKMNALTKIRTGLNIASITAAGIQGAKSISAGGGGGSTPPPNIRGTQTTRDNNTNQRQPDTKVFVTETDIRAVSRKVDGIYSQATIR
jgi:hypothetical protein